jgi:CheY-like chemotaxis protein
MAMSIRTIRTDRYFKYFNYCLGKSINPELVLQRARPRDKYVYVVIRPQQTDRGQCARFALMECLNRSEWDAHVVGARGHSTRRSQLAPRILLADDQKEIRQAVASVLRDCFEIVGLAENGKQVLELVRRRTPDVLVLDIFMPVLNGIETVAHLKESGCPSKVLFLTVHEDSDFLETAISMGVLGYVLKPHLATDLIPAIRTVLQGHLYISPSMKFS